MERDLSTGVGATDPRVCVEFPVESDRLPSPTPSRSLSGVDQPPACVTPPEPMRTSSISTASVCPARAPRTSIGPISACPASSSPSRRSGYTSCSAVRQPALRHENAIESPGSTVRIGSRSREKWPWSVRRSSGISCSATRRRELGEPRRRRARPTACTRPRSASTDTERRIRSRARPAPAGRRSPSPRERPPPRRRSRTRAAPPARRRRAPSRATDASRPSSSSGLSERRSSTSHDASSPSASAAASATCTIAPYATIVRSEPSRAIRDSPSGTTCSPSGTSSLDVR